MGIRCCKKIGIQTICIILMTLGLYSGITTRSAAGLTGTCLFIGMMTLILEVGIYKVTNFRMDKWYGSVLFFYTCVSVLILMICPDIAFTRMGLAVISAGFVSIYLLAVLKWTESLIGKVVVFICMAGVLFSLLYLQKNMGSFSPDSYSYYEIAQSFSKDFGLIDTIRQYVIRSDYNISFPYFYPLCISCVDGITKLGRYSGILFNVYCMMFTGLLFLKISKHLVKRFWCGGVAAFVLFTNTYYLSEVSAARAIPLSILITTMFFWLCAQIYLEDKELARYPFWAGMCAGIATVVRFEALILVVYGIFIIFLMKKGKRIKSVIYYLSGVLVFAVPWVLYSWKHFQTLWISDNLGTVFLVEPTVPNRVIAENEWVATLFNAPNEWWVSLGNKISEISLSFFKCSYGAIFCILVCMLSIFFSAKNKGIVEKKSLIATGMVIVYYIGKTFMYMLVGYKDIRYHVESVVLVAFLLILFSEKYCFRYKKKIFYMIPIVACAGALINGAGEIWKLREGLLVKPLEKVEVAPEWVNNLNKELENVLENKEAEILFLGEEAEAFQFGGWTDWKIYVNPAEVNLKRVQYMMKAYMEVEYVIWGKESYLPEEIYEWLNESYEEIQLRDFFVFEVTNRQ